MRSKVEIFFVDVKTGRPRKAEHTFEVEGRSHDDLRAAARARLERAGGKVRSVSHGARGLIVYVEVKR